MADFATKLKAVGRIHGVNVRAAEGELPVGTAVDIVFRHLANGHREG
nr:hypothetical protein [Paenibacillus sp.]